MPLLMSICIILCFMLLVYDAQGVPIKIAGECELQINMILVLLGNNMMFKSYQRAISYLFTKKSLSNYVNFDSMIKMYMSEVKYMYFRNVFYSSDPKNVVFLNSM